MAEIRSDRKIVKQERLYIEGMTCINCQNKIERELRKMPEIKAFSVSYEKGTADISYKEKEISPEQLMKAIENLGYQASLKPPSAQKAVCCCNISGS